MIRLNPVFHLLSLEELIAQPRYSDMTERIKAKIQKAEVAMGVNQTSDLQGGKSSLRSSQLLLGTNEKKEVLSYENPRQRFYPDS